MGDKWVMDKFARTARVISDSVFFLGIVTVSRLDLLLQSSRKVLSSGCKIAPFLLCPENTHRKLTACKTGCSGNNLT